MAKIIPFEKRRLLMKAFIESQFSYCPLVWMFCSRKMNKRINFIHERSLRIVYDDYDTTLEDLLKKDNSVSIHHRNVQKVSIEMFKVKHNLCPEFIQNIFHQKNSTTRSKATFHRPNVNYSVQWRTIFKKFRPNCVGQDVAREYNANH